MLNNLKTIAERCLQVAPVLDRKGNQVMVGTPNGGIAPVFTFDSAGANRATELVGKHLMMLSDKTVHAVQFKVAQEEASKIMEAARRRIETK